MAQIINADTGETINVDDNSMIKEACAKIGVPFNCENGICGTCIVKVVEGKENMGELNDSETDMGLDGEYRLACQCKIKKGKVKLKY
ncbi:(2Fe-2S)-binding protein [Candidatus Pacearchaeota archaeon]|nr:(2Fe-2S)-binding protein [Candidatus Pacearchaeota archaeon]